jgi:hypothetical protein
MIYEYSEWKWLELLKEIAPNVTRVAIIRNPDNPVGVALFGAIQAEARSLRVEVSPVDSRLGIVLKMRPARFPGHPEHVLGQILVRVFDSDRVLREERGSLRFESAGDVF